MPDYTAKVDELFKLAVSLKFTELDFAHLCVAAADQAGMCEDDQTELKQKLICTNCERAIGNYGATDKDEKIAPSAGLCEECHSDEVRAVERRRRDDEHDGMSVGPLRTNNPRMWWR